ncbi:hypothetical protein GDO78_016247 [Eleutherodactylus coqui]|uniref:Uncharacterized protein n=1 Tax=Eleutherodactylus coqui TaxID=57060 RepID=A0A8J6JSE9_ELECQ|nr:hypothetical protein GDO78_016247 [Eleutherodactylus coqui]
METWGAQTAGLLGGSRAEATTFSETTTGVEQRPMPLLECWPARRRGLYQLYFSYVTTCLYFFTYSFYILFLLLRTVYHH